MTPQTRRILISCAVVLAAVILCVGAIGVAGLAVFTLRAQSPAVVTQQVPPRQQLETPVPIPSPQQDQITPPEPAPPGQPLPPEQPQEPQEPVPAPPDSALSPEIERQMDEIEIQVSELRGLERLGPVTRAVLSPEELRQRVIEDFLEDYTPEDARDDAIELDAFGLLERDFDLYDFYLELYSEQIAGFYDDDEKAMYVVQGSDFLGPQRLTYAHEFVHALQDQHYNFKEGLNYTDESCKEDTERCAALQALIEGDASFTEIQWYFSYATPQDQREIQEFYRDYTSPIFDDAPSFFRESLLFPYIEGQEFVMYLYERGDWDAIENAYANPPVSTEQILHPERYPDDQPIPVELPDFTTVLGESWREVSNNVIGEFSTYLILAHGKDENARLDEEEARSAASGWGGDHYLIYHDDDRGETVLVVKFIWDSEADSMEFSAAFRRHTDLRFGSGNTEPDGFTTWQSLDGYTKFDSSGNETIWIFAPNQATAELVWESIR
jgi:hypothetical protein